MGESEAAHFGSVLSEEAEKSFGTQARSREASGSQLCSIRTHLARRQMLTPVGHTITCWLWLLTVAGLDHSPDGIAEDTVVAPD